MRARACGLLLMLALTQTVNGADRVEVGTVLSIDLSRATITDVKRKEDTSLLAVNTFTIRRNETVRIEVLQNLLLFTYEAKSSKADTTEYAAALEFAKQLQALLALFPAPKANAIARVKIGALDPDQLRKDLQTVLDFHSRLGSHLAASLGGPDQVAALKKEYQDADLEALSKRLEEAYLELVRILLVCTDPNGVLASSGGPVRCDGSSDLDVNLAVTQRKTALTPLLAQVATLEKEGRAGELTVAALKADLERAEAALKAAAKEPAKAKEVTAKVDGLKAQVAAAQKQLDGLMFMFDRLEADRAARVKEISEAEAGGLAKGTLGAFARDMSATQSKIGDLLTVLQAFASDVSGIGKPFVLATVPHSIQQDTETIEIKAGNKYDKYLDSATRKKRDSMLKKFDVVLKPYQPAHLSLAPAFVLGFVRNPEFTAVKDGDAFKIERKQEELNRYTLGIMMNITPDGWQEPTFGGHFQVGISPVKDSLGFFAGAGIKAQKILSFGAGLMIQQVRKLGGGLALDSRLDDPAKLKTEREFKRGLYLHVTVEIPK
jgi:hypothetical protein